MYVSGRVILSETPTTFAEELANYLGTQIEIMRSQQIHDRSIQRLALAGLNPVENTELSIDVIKNTTILMLRSESGDAKFAQRYLDALMTEFIEFKKDRRLAASQSTLEQISEEIVRLERELNQHELAFFEFRENNNIGVWAQQSEASAQFLNDLKGKESNIRLHLSLLDNWREIVRNENISLVAQANVPGLSSGPNFEGQGEALAEIRRELNKLSIERKLRLRVLRPAHPIVQKIDREIELQKLPEESAAEELSGQREERRWALTSELASLQEAILEWEKKALDSSRIEAEYQKLLDARDRTKELYDRMVSALRNIDIGKGVDQELIQVLQPAGGAQQINPEYRKNTVKGALLGGLIGWGVLVLLIRTDDRAYELESTVDHLDCSALGEVPLVTKARLASRRTRYEKAAFEESFRGLRSLLDEGSAEKQLRLLVTSSIASEGKTEISVQLGKAFADADHKVLLVDADLRRGRMRRMFPEIDSSALGLGGYLANPNDPAAFIQPTNIPNLWIIPRGDESKSSGELLSRKIVKSQVQALFQDFAVVIIDSAPVGPVNDSIQLIPVVDKVLFVIRAGSTTLMSARQNVKRIKESGANDIKLILNGVKARISSKYYNYYR